MKRAESVNMFVDLKKDDNAMADNIESVARANSVFNKSSNVSVQSELFVQLEPKR